VKQTQTYEKPNEDPLSLLGELTYGLLRGDYELVKSFRTSEQEVSGYSDSEYRFVCKAKGSHHDVRTQ